jgi:hypothetical protein
LQESAEEASEQITGAFIVLLLFQIWPALAELKESPGTSRNGR